MSEMVSCVCGVEFFPAYRGQEHCSATCRKGAKKPAQKRQHVPGFEDVTRRCRVLDCSTRTGPAHHVVYQQHLDDYGGDPGDPDNALSLCILHHEQHHKGTRRVKISELRPENLQFARKLLGAYAEDYLGIYYNAAV